MKGGKAKAHMSKDLYFDVFPRTCRLLAGWSVLLHLAMDSDIEILEVKAPMDFITFCDGFHNILRRISQHFVTDFATF